MSHYNLLVITKEEPTDETLSALLQPYHEFECTGVDDEFVKDIDVTKDALEDFAKFANEGQAATDYFSGENKPVLVGNRTSEHRYGYTILNEDGSIKQVIDRTNPNRKWDWWVVGGRWGGYLINKHTGTEHDCLQKKDLKLDSYPESESIAFAILHEGQWAEAGRMGWWACVSDENKDWPEQSRKMLESLPGDLWITVVDCHI